MAEEWVMLERKVIMVEKKREQSGGIIMVDRVPRVFNAGDPAPEGHEGRPYTRKVVPAAVEARQEDHGANRMQKPGHTRKKK